MEQIYEFNNEINNETHANKFLNKLDWNIYTSVNININNHYLNSKLQVQYT